MSPQVRATRWSLLAHAILFLVAVVMGQHSPPGRLPVVLDVSILLSTDPLYVGPPQAPPTARPAPPPPAPVEKNILPAPAAKKTPPPLARQKLLQEKKPPVETVAAAIVPHTQSREAAPWAPAVDAAAGNASPANAPTAPGAAQGGGARMGGGGIYNAGQLDEPLAAIAKAPPIYPPAAKRRSIEGWIKVKFLIDEQGQVGRISVLDAAPEGVFDQAVLRCISGWRFKPGTKDGVAVKALVEQTITFKLEG